MDYIRGNDRPNHDSEKYYETMGVVGLPPSVRVMLGRIITECHDPESDPACVVEKDAEQKVTEEVSECAANAMEKAFGDII